MFRSRAKARPVRGDHTRGSEHWHPGRGHVVRDTGYWAGCSADASVRKVTRAPSDCKRRGQPCYPTSVARLCQGPGPVTLLSAARATPSPRRPRAASFDSAF